MPVDAEYLPVRADLAAWLETQADEEDLDVVDLLARCIEREKRRVGGNPVDNRTRRPGVQGSASRFKKGELTTEQMADAVGVSKEILKAKVAAGILVPATRGTVGTPHVWHSTQCLGVAVIVRLPLDRLSDELDLLRTWAATITHDACRKGSFVVYYAGGAARAVIVASAGLPPLLAGTAEAATVIALEPLGAMLNWLHAAA